eukprot:3941011-Rhodomonas_salina.1
MKICHDKEYVAVNKPCKLTSGGKCSAYLQIRAQTQRKWHNPHQVVISEAVHFLASLPDIFRRANRFHAQTLSSFTASENDKGCRHWQQFGAC